MTFESITLLAAVAACLVSIVSFFKSSNKEQLTTDGDQNDKIAKLTTKTEVLDQRLADLYRQTSALDGEAKQIANKLGAEIRDVEEKIERRLSTMENNLTQLITSFLKGTK